MQTVFINSLKSFCNCVPVMLNHYTTILRVQFPDREGIIKKKNKGLRYKMQETPKIIHPARRGFIYSILNFFRKLFHFIIYGEWK